MPSLRAQFNNETAKEVMVPQKYFLFRFSEDYVYWLEEKVLSQKTPGNKPYGEICQAWEAGGYCKVFINSPLRGGCGDEPCKLNHA